MKIRAAESDKPANLASESGESSSKFLEGANPAGDNSNDKSSPAPAQDFQNRESSPSFLAVRESGGESKIAESNPRESFAPPENRAAQDFTNRAAASAANLAALNPSSANSSAEITPPANPAHAPATNHAANPALWLNALKIALINDCEADALSLIEDLPTFDSIGDLVCARELTAGLIERLKSKKDATKEAMQKLQAAMHKLKNMKVFLED